MGQTDRQTATSFAHCNAFHFGGGSPRDIIISWQLLLVKSAKMFINVWLSNRAQW